MSQIRLPLIDTARMLEHNLKTMPNKRNLHAYEARVVVLSLLMTGAFLCLCSSGIMATEDTRRVIPLDGVWQIAEGGRETPPRTFERVIPVPGLADMASPPFDESIFSERRRSFGPLDDALRQRSLWYRREFRFDGAVPAAATLLVRKAAFGSTVILNGVTIGERNACFTSGHYDARPALRGEGQINELLIRVGTTRVAVPAGVPSGWDFEKLRYLPGIFDSVELILSGTPNVLRVQTAPNVSNQTVRVQATIRNGGSDLASELKFTVREAKSGRTVARASEKVALASGEERTVDTTLRLKRCRLWSPDSPFLYELQVDTGADTLRTRFGMREFRFEPGRDGQPGRALLNGQPYFMRGSNVTLYRFFEDSERGDKPWREEWVRLLHQRFKDMNWNALRYCIGFPPEIWYSIADEEGLLIQDEFPIWESSENPTGITSDELTQEYREWIEERCNHPCVVIWDAQNETITPETGQAIQRVRGLDLSNRPWDNGWSPPQAPSDVHESHPYHFGNPNMRLSSALSAPKEVPEVTNPIIINEYGWLWLNRDGSPTALTRDLYRNLAGADASPQELFTLYARLLAAETEYWRCRRVAAGVLHFCALGYSRPGTGSSPIAGATSDHWADVEKLIWNPEFYRYVRDAFAPVGLMVDFCRETVVGGIMTQIPVVVINDLQKPWRGPVTLCVRSDEGLLLKRKRNCRVCAWGQTTILFDVIVPLHFGPSVIEAQLRGADGRDIRSLRDVEIIDPGAEGLAFQKPALASSTYNPAYRPENAVDGVQETYWSSEFKDEAWLAVDLGEIRKIRRALIIWETAFSRVFSVQVSADGQNWADVFATSEGQGGTSDIRFEPVHARWVRLYATRRGTEWGHGVREMKVFE